jgi:hypothetical protein
MAEELTPAQLVELVRRDRRRRWQQGERVSVETYLQQYPALAADPERILDLVYHEVLLREELGEAPPLDEYLARFPGLTAQLRPLFEVHRAVAEGQLFPPAESEAARPAPPPTEPGRGDGEQGSAGGDCPEGRKD